MLTRFRSHACGLRRWLISGASFLAAATAVASEPADLDRAARDFRITTYNAFRRDRAEFDRRHAVWREIEIRWSAEAGSGERAEVLAAWLAQAAEANRQGRPLPSAPQITSRDVVRGNIDKAAAPPRATTQPVAPPLVADAIPLAKRPTKVTQPAKSIDDIAISDAPIAGGETALPPRATDDVQADHLSPRETARPPAELDVTSAPIDAPEIPRTVDDGINVAQVAVRVAGYNLAVATLHDDIERNSRPTGDDMAEFARRVNALMLRADDLSPYFALVSAEEQTQLGVLASLDGVVELLGKRNAEIARRARGDD